MINDLVEKCDFPTGKKLNGELKSLAKTKHLEIGQVISSAENYGEENKDLLEKLNSDVANFDIPILGITGTGGAGKSF